MSLPVIAIVGRPNVGKSHLFNRIIGEASAIVSEEAGTTRDRHFGQADWAGHHFWLVDTGGLVEDSNEPMDVAIRKQVMQAIEEADLLMLVVDAKVGVHPSDARLVDILRHAKKPWVLVANKVDDPNSSDFYDFYRLGVTDVYPVSAANGKGSGDLLDAVVAAIPETDEVPSEAVRIAVIGRPNVGKSSFVNKLLGEERLADDVLEIRAQVGIDGRRGKNTGQQRTQRATHCMDAEGIKGVIVAEHRFQLCHREERNRPGKDTDPHGRGAVDKSASGRHHDETGDCTGAKPEDAGLLAGEVFEESPD